MFKNSVANQVTGSHCVNSVIALGVDILANFVTVVQIL